MPKPYDATTKFLLEFNPSGWKPFLGIQSSARVETIDADVSTVSGQADKVLRVLDRIPWLIHLELQASRDPLLALRMQRYNVLLEYKFGCVVYSVVLLLRLSADGPELTGRRQSRRPDGPLISDFRYDVIRLWQLTPEQILSGDLVTLPLAPLTMVSQRQMPRLVQQVHQRLCEETQAPQRGDLMDSMFVLTGLRFPPDIATPWFQGVTEMRESLTYQAILEEGAEKGREEGLRDAVLRAGRHRFGPPTPKVRAALKKEQQIDRLEEMLDRMFDVKTWDALLKAK